MNEAVTQATKARLKYETLGALLKRAMAPRKHLIAPWLKESESALIYAPPGAGKSMLTLSLALAVAGGGSMMDWHSPEPRRVLLIDGEMNEADLKDRAAALIGAVPGIDQGEAERNLMILARQSQDPDADFPDLATKPGQDVVLRKARRGKHALLILDNFSTLVTCEDENSAAAFNDIVRFLMRVKQAGIACILVHHTNKSGDNYRGSSKLATTFEAIMGMRKGETGSTEGPAFSLSFDKFRGKAYDEVTKPRDVRLLQTPDGLRWTHEATIKQQVLDLVAAVRTCEFASQDALAAHLGVAKGTVSKWKTAAIHQHKLITEDEFGACLAAAQGGDLGEF